MAEPFDPGWDNFRLADVLTSQAWTGASHGHISFWSACPASVLLPMPAWGAHCRPARPTPEAEGGSGKADRKQSCFGLVFQISGTVYFSTSLIKWDVAALKGRVGVCAGHLAAGRQMSLVKHTRTPLLLQWPL